MSSKAVCRLANAKQVPSANKAPVQVQTGKAETYSFETASTENDESRLSVVKGIVKTFLFKPFCIMNRNTLEVSVRLPESMKGATLGDARSKIVPVRELILVSPINASPVYQARLNKKRQFHQHRKVTKADKQNREIDRKNLLIFNQKHDNVKGISKH